MHTPKAQSKDGWEINGPASAFTHRTSQAFDGSTTPSPLCNNTEPSRTLTNYLLCFLKEIANVFQRLCSWVLGQDVSDLIDFLLHRVHSLLVRANHATDLQGLGFLQELLGPVVQLSDDHVPNSKALVAGCAVRKDPRVPPGALVTAWTLDALDADTLAGGLVTLRRLNTPGVTVTG